MKEPPRRVAIVGLGYVGLPVAVAFARRFPGTVGFDVDEQRVSEVRSGHDRTRAVSPQALAEVDLVLTTDAADLVVADFYVVAVPTPIDGFHRPDLSPLESASRVVGAALRKGDVVVFESTVYPGVTEDICARILEQASGLVARRDFKLGYSPERINPGDEQHTLASTVKIVSAQDEETLAIVADCYAAIVPAGLHRASSIQVAEAAKVIENVQRDLNIALMNELAMIFDRIGLDTAEVLEAASTKWNFHRYHPGLVGGHCIGIDPYYLTTKAESVGINPEVILAGRRVNDEMGRFVAAKAIKLMIRAGHTVQGARVAVLGLAFKAGVSDARNSRVPDIVSELEEYGTKVLVHDPLLDPELVQREYGIELVDADELHGACAIILATPHAGLAPLALRLAEAATGTAVLLDVLAAIDRRSLPETCLAWRL